MKSITPFKDSNDMSAKQLFALTLLAAAGSANAGYEVKIDQDSSITFGGFIAMDARFVSGDIAYRDFWVGSGTVLPTNAKQFKLSAKETRFNTKFVHGDVTGFLELDFHGSAQGNEVISNSYAPRLRHAYISYNNVLMGQTWSTFMNTSAIPESADFAGATTGLVFIRQGQVRYNVGNFQVSLENPESWGGDTASDSVPDIVARYNFKGDWGSVSVSGLARQLNTTLGNSESAFGASVAGRIKTGGKDDIRFQFHKGELGRYVGVGAVKDLYGEEVEDVTSVLVAYRHFWNESLRSTVLYGKVEGDASDRERTQWGVNLFQDLTKELAVGIEVGNFSIDELDKDSNYVQATMRYML